jgi:hypothetical protein
VKEKEKEKLRVKKELGEEKLYKSFCTLTHQLNQQEMCCFLLLLASACDLLFSKKDFRDQRLEITHIGLSY